MSDGRSRRSPPTSSRPGHSSWTSLAFGFACPAMRPNTWYPFEVRSWLRYRPSCPVIPVTSARFMRSSRREDSSTPELARDPARLPREARFARSIRRGIELEEEFGPALRFVGLPDGLRRAAQTVEGRQEPAVLGM